MSRRLLIAARSAVPHRSAGYQRLTWDVAATLRSRGWDVTVLTTPVPGRRREFGVDGLHVVTVPGTWQGDERAWAKRAPDLARRLGMESFDAVLGFGPAGQALRPRTPRTVAHCRDTLLHDAAAELSADAKARGLPLGLPPRWSMRRLMRELDYLRRADGILVSAPRARDVLWRWPYRALARTPPAVVRDGVMTRRFRPDPEAGLAWRRRNAIPDDAPLVAMVGRLVPGRGLLDAVAAFRAFRHRFRKARLVLIGTGPYHSAVRQRVLDLHLGRHVDFLGRLPDADMVRWLQGADLFLHLPPACDPAPPLNVLEALACGVPVVTTTAAVDPQQPHPLLHAVPPGQPAAAALAMAQVWQDRVRDGRAGCRAPFPKAWTMEASALGYDAILRGTVAPRPPQRPAPASLRHVRPARAGAAAPVGRPLPLAPGNRPGPAAAGADGARSARRSSRLNGDLLSAPPSRPQGLPSSARAFGHLRRRPTRTALPP